MDNSFELVWPRMRKVMMREAKGLPITFEDSFDTDKLTIRHGAHAIGISRNSIRAAFENDAYDTLDNAAKDAVMYLRILAYGNAKKYRAFRTKLRSIRARNR